MELRFIERDGKRILQSRTDCFPWKDVPFVDDRIQVGPGGDGLAKLRLASDLVAERDTLRALLNDAEARCKRLEVVEGVAYYWRKEYRALRDAVRAQGAHTAAEVFNTVIRIRSET